MSQLSHSFPSVIEKYLFYKFSHEKFFHLKQQRVIFQELKCK